MRIVFVTTEFVTEAYYSGGLANYLHRLSLALAGMGHDIHVILPASGAPGERGAGKIRIHDVSPATLPFWARAVIRMVPGDSRGWLGFAAAAWRQLEALHKAAPVDLVQVTNLQACGVLIVHYSAVPHLTRLSSLPEWERQWVRPVRRWADRVGDWLEHLQIRRSRNLCAPSRTLAASAERHHAGRVEVLRSPAFIETEDVDRDWAARTLGDRPYLLFVGRLEPRKGAHVLGQALPAVFRAHPDCEAVFAGQDRPDPAGRSVKAQIREWCHGFESRLHFLGELPHVRLYGVMERARLVVLPSLADNLPNAMLEAMCLGRPVVGTIGVSFDEVIEDGRSGFLIPPGDPAALAAKLVEAWTHPELDRIGAAARAAMEPFARDVTIRSHLEHYARIVGGQRPSGGA